MDEDNNKEDYAPYLIRYNLEEREILFRMNANRLIGEIQDFLKGEQ
jgi:hypothetical protein